jgi:hypothetical protein
MEYEPATPIFKTLIVHRPIKNLFIGHGPAASLFSASIGHRPIKPPFQPGLLFFLALGLRRDT